LTVREAEQVNLRKNTTQTGLKSIMLLKELLEIEDEETYYQVQASAGKIQYEKLINNI